MLIHCGPHSELIKHVIGVERYEALEAHARANPSFSINFAPDLAALRDDGELSHASALAQQCIDRREYFYFGITGWPIERFEEHHPRRFDRMILVAAYHESRDSARLERQLIDAFQGVDGLCQNLAPGGERASADSPHYTYIVCGTRLRPP